MQRNVGLKFEEFNNQGATSEGTPYVSKEACFDMLSQLAGFLTASVNTLREVCTIIPSSSRGRNEQSGIGPSLTGPN